MSIKVDHGDDDNLPPMLKLEIQLNLDPKQLKLQLEEILREHENYVNSFDRWRFSTASVIQSGETKITYASITRWLKVYSDVLTRLPTHKASDIDLLLPHIWKPAH